MLGPWIFLALAAWIKPVFAETCPDALSKAKVRWKFTGDAGEVHASLSWNGGVAMECTRLRHERWSCGGRTFRGGEYNYRFPYLFHSVYDSKGTEWYIVDKKVYTTAKCQRISRTQFVTEIKYAYSGTVEGAKIPVYQVFIDKSTVEVVAPSF